MVFFFRFTLAIDAIFRRFSPPLSLIFAVTTAADAMPLFRHFIIDAIIRHPSQISLRYAVSLIFSSYVILYAACRHAADIDAAATFCHAVARDARSAAR